MNTLTVNLTKICENYNYLRSLTNAQVGAVIKSDAYGLGMREIGPVLEKTGCRHFFVTNLEEALSIRPLLDKKSKIYVLHGITPEEEVVEFYYNNVIPVLNSVEQVDIWYSLATERALSLPYVVHVDTGMNRLGINYKEFNKITNKSLKLSLVISHLACADDITNPYNKMQYEKFKKVQDATSNTLMSLANSSGIFLGPEYHFDLVRPGAALYGIQPNSVPNSLIQNPVTYTSQIIQIAKCDDGSYVGYGATYRLSRDSTIATIPLGYSDKYLYNWGNKGYVVIDTYMAPIVGRISMNLITIDVTEIPAKFIYLGQCVEVIGGKCTPEQLAVPANTIGYEVLTNFASIKNRKYVY